MRKNNTGSAVNGQRADKSNLMRQIDENLKRVYMNPKEGEVPDRFASLLDQLKKQDTPDED